MTILNRRNLDNPAQQKMPQTQRAWTHYQNEINRVQTGSWTPTWSGFSVDPVGDVVWTRDGNHVTLRCEFGLGTSNAITMIITNFPVELNPAQIQYHMVSQFKDGGAASTEVVVVEIPAVGGQNMAFHLGADAGGWTATATDKGPLTNLHILYSLTG